MSERSDRLYCQDILEAGAAIQSYVEGIDFATFGRDRMRYSAVIREFEIIGEAVGKLSAGLKQAYPDIPWQDIKDFAICWLTSISGLTWRLFGIRFGAICQW